MVNVPPRRVGVLDDAEPGCALFAPCVELSALSSSIGVTMYVRHASLSATVWRLSHCVMLTWWYGPICISLRWRWPLMYVVPSLEFPAIVVRVVNFRSAACAAAANTQSTETT